MQHNVTTTYDLFDPCIQYMCLCRCQGVALKCLHWLENFHICYSGPSKVKVTVKGAAAVDPESELEDTHHVLETKGLIWNAVLNAVDIVKGTNSYYKLQVLESDGGVFKTYCVFRSWGRIGTTIGGTKVEVRATHPLCETLVT